MSVPFNAEPCGEQYLDGPGAPAGLRAAFVVADVHRARPVGRVHVRVRHCGGTVAAGREDPDPGARHLAVGADPRVLVDHGDRCSSRCSRTRCLGLECASIFAIFTSQAWNMTFSFYHSLITQPRELDEAARVLRLTKWQRFWKLDVPGSMIGLVWNGMMSFGGGWFFLTASEAITVNKRTYALPGIGSYVAAASSPLPTRPGVARDRRDDRDDPRGELRVLAADGRVVGTVPDRGERSHREAAELAARCVAPLACPATGWAVHCAR